jgi:ABC-type nitrate/sulfonate/bicarbonate transport system substrate-binding protein
MQYKRNRLLIVLTGLLALSMAMAACQPTAPAPVEAPETEEPAAPAPATEEPVAAATEEPVAETEAPAELVPVRVGMTPFFDYQFWSVAKEFGWDKELGLDLQFTWLTQSGPSIQALAGGELDMVNTCVVCNFPFYESVPEMVDFLNVNQFKGFVVIGRQGQSKSYEEFLTELGDPEKAKIAAIEQMKGKTFPIYLANYEPLLTAVLDQAGLTLSDITTINFSDDEKAALAAIGGEGDFYMGGLPSELNLLMNHSDQFKLIGGAEILGPAGLWYSNIASTKDWLAANPEAAYRIMAMSYRYNRYVQEKFDEILPLVIEAMNAHSGVATDPDQLKYTFDTFLEFRTYQQDKETAFNPESDLYWEQSAKYYVEKSKDLPEGADYLLTNPMNEWFEQFLQQQVLLDWVDKPLE